MLFNSYIFIYVFLPISLLGYFAFGRIGHHRVAIAWLVGASLFYYSWWNPAYLGLILLSIFVNYSFGVVLGNHKKYTLKKSILGAGVAFNLGLIGYFKYANFFIENFRLLTGSSFHLETIILPLAISFFTFQQIAYLVDAYKGETREHSFLHYCLFVTFFPQLIAGPIVHHKEMMPQFTSNAIYRLEYRNLAIGLTIFVIGLTKKVLLADGVAAYSTPVFNAAESDVALTFFEAWGGALAYTLQLYFDFSGYSDMAIGIAKMFGIRLPLNFNSPYKARNIIDFWRRWHITLSRFLRDYLYITLGGNRKGRARKYINIFTTMILGGLWHGAGWTFILWGGLHGLYLIINHGWHSLRRLLGHNLEMSYWFGRGVARIITFITVVISWVFFRAESFHGAKEILGAMIGANGLSLSGKMEATVGKFSPWLASHDIVFQGMFHNDLANWQAGIELIFLLLILVFFFPNTQQVMFRYKPAFETYHGEIKQFYNGWLEWKPSLISASATALLLYYTLSNLVRESEFLYFNF